MTLNLKKLVFAALPLLLPACAQEEPGDGRMPMEFTVSLADESPQSRVSESDDGSKSVWTEGDKITVNVTQGSNTQTATCTLGSDGNIKDYSKTLYWESRESATVSASYSNLGANNSIADQSSGLAYVLRADASTTYGNTISLTFRHQFAKVRIKFEGSKASEVTDVKINNYTQCTVASDGKVTGSSGTEGYILMRKNGDYYEANVCPVSSLPENFIYAGEYFKVSVTGISKLEAGNVYTITIKAREALIPEITVMGHQAVLMREASGTPGNADYVPALYFATTNIGADSPGDPGLYFWWGDVTGHRSTENFDFSSSNDNIITNNLSITNLKSEGILTEDEVLSKNYDAAQYIWEGEWRMPTADEWKWLKDNCVWAWYSGSGENLTFDSTLKKEDKFTVSTLYSGVVGFYGKSKESGQIIFLPAAGTFNKFTHNFYNYSGCYWSSKHRPSVGYAEYCRLAAENHGVSKGVTNMGVYIGASIRPVIAR